MAEILLYRLFLEHIIEVNPPLDSQKVQRSTKFIYNKEGLRKMMVSILWLTCVKTFSVVT
jgi:hypothetical protein